MPFNPVDDFLRAATATTSLLDQTEARKQRGQLLDLRQAQFADARRTNAHQRLYLDEQRDIQADERQRVETARLVTAAGLRAMSEATRPDGSLDFDAYNKTLNADPTLRSLIDHAVEQAEPGSQFEHFAPAPRNPNVAVAVIRRPDGQRDVLADPGEHGEVFTFPADPKHGGPAISGFQLLAQYNPEAAGALLDRVATQRQTNAKNQGLGRVAGAYAEALTGTGSQAVPAAGIQSARVDQTAPPAAPPAATRPTGLSAAELQATPEVGASPIVSEGGPDRSGRPDRGGAEFKAALQRAKDAGATYEEVSRLAQTADQQAAVDLAYGEREPSLAEGLYPKIPSAPSLTDALSPISSANASEPAGAAPPSVDQPLTARRAGDLTRKGLVASASTLYGATAGPVIDALPAAASTLYDATARPAGDFVAGLLGLPERPEHRHGGATGSWEGPSEPVSRPAAEPPASEKAPATSPASDKVTNQARVAVTRAVRQDPRAADALKTMADEVRKGNLSLSDFHTLAKDFKQAPAEINKIVSSEDKTVNYGIDKQGNVLAVYRLPAAPPKGSAAGAPAVAEGRSLDNASKRLKLQHDIAAQVFPGEEKFQAPAQAQVVDALQNLEDLGLTDTINPNNVGLLRIAKGIIASEVDSGIHRFRRFNNFSEVAPADWVKAILASQSGFESISALQEKLLDPIKNSVEVIAKVDPNLAVDAGTAAQRAAAVAGQLMREHGFSREQSVQALRAELAHDPRFAAVLAHGDPRAIAEVLAARGGI